MEQVKNFIPNLDTAHKILLHRPEHIDPRVKGMAEYLKERFLRNNHSKYHKYCNEWMINITPDQLRYFINERRRIETGVVLK